MGREIRRNQDFLISIGTGVMLFGLWSVVWSLIQLIINAEDITECQYAVSDVREIHHESRARPRRSSPGLQLHALPVHAVLGGL